MQCLDERLRPAPSRSVASARVLLPEVYCHQSCCLVGGVRGLAATCRGLPLPPRLLLQQHLCYLLFVPPAVSGTDESIRPPIIDELPGNLICSQQWNTQCCAGVPVSPRNPRLSNVISNQDYKFVPTSPLSPVAAAALLSFLLREAKRCLPRRWHEAYSTGKAFCLKHTLPRYVPWTRPCEIDPGNR